MSTGEQQPAATQPAKQPEPEDQLPPQGQPSKPTQMQNVDADAARLETHEDLVSKARKDRAKQEAARRLNRIHEIEMQIKSQQSRQPDFPIKDDKGRTWEDYHDTFWKAKRNLLYPDDPESLNRHLAQYLGEERDIAWMDESQA